MRPATLPEEAESRRADWSAGYPCPMADGQVWYLPRLVATARPVVGGEGLCFRFPSYTVAGRPFDPEFDAAYRAGVDAVLDATDRGPEAVIEATAGQQALILMANYAIDRPAALGLGLLGFLDLGIDPCAPDATLDSYRDAYSRMGCDLLESIYRLDRTIRQEVGRN